MPQREDTVRLHHMLDAAKEAFSFVQDKERRDLDKDRKLVLSLVRLVEVIGEAAGSVSKEFRAVHPHIPWPAIIGMRNRWDTVKDDLPPLVASLEKISKG